MIKHPSHLFITYLVFLGKTLREVIDTLSDYGLPAIPEEYQTEMYAGVQLELGGKKLEDYSPGKDLDTALSNHKIAYLVHPDKVLTSCTKLLDNRSCKNDLYMSLIGRVSTDVIVDHINKTLSLIHI